MHPRMYPRYNSSISVEFPGHPSLQSSRLLDISAGGMLLDLAQDRAVGDRFPVIMHFEVLGEVVEAEARVAWTNGSRVGVAFDWDEDDDLIILDLFIRHDQMNAA